MDADEDDYMSAAFVSETPSAPSKPTTYAELRKAARRRGEDSVIRNAKRPRHEREAEAREQALNRSLFDTPTPDSPVPAAAPANKALGMMMRMGFKPGQALGAAAATTSASASDSDAPPPKPSTARLEPLKPEMRDRASSLSHRAADLVQAGQASAWSPPSTSGGD